MKNQRIWSGVWLGAALCCCHSLSARDRQPNIIMFLVDDMGWQDTSVPFHEDTTNLNRRFRTPGMEKLARMGVCFTEAYACPVSSPSRCSLMSGMNAARHRVTNWTHHYNGKTDAGSPVIRIPEWAYNGIQPEGADAHSRAHATMITALPQILKDNGYYTIHCGKAHFGAESTAGADPLNFGFDVNIAGGANGGVGSYLGLDNFGANTGQPVKGLEAYHGQDVFLTDVLTDEAIKALRKPVEEGKPFYLYMSHYAVHYADRAQYNDDKKRSAYYRSLTGKDPQLGEKLQKNEIKYAAIVEGMDASLMRLIEFVESLPRKERENTVILFMSDNGGQALNNARQGVANRDQNYPARAGKGSLFLGGVREPMIVSWPARVKGNRRTDHRVLIEDFFTSILDIAGVKEYQTCQTVDGKSFKKALLSSRKADYERPLFWHFPNLWGETQDKEEGYGAVSSILKGDMHLLYTWETQTLRLYNVREDIGEQHDLSAQRPEMVRELARELTDYLKSCEAQRPSYKSTGKDIPWPDEAASRF